MRVWDIDVVSLIVGFLGAFLVVNYTRSMAHRKFLSDRRQEIVVTLGKIKQEKLVEELASSYNYSFVQKITEAPELDNVAITQKNSAAQAPMNFFRKPESLD